MFSAGQFLVGTLALGMAMESGLASIEREQVSPYVMLRAPHAVVLALPHSESSVSPEWPTATRQQSGYVVSAAVSGAYSSGLSSLLGRGLAS